MTRGPASEADRLAWTRPGLRTVADGVHRIPCPLPNDGLRAVNVHVIEIDGGLALVDAGARDPLSAAALEAGLAELGAGLADVRVVLCTHAHYDHYGLAGELQRRHGARVHLGRTEVRLLSVARDRAAYEAWIAARDELLRRHGAADLADAIAGDAGAEFDSVRASTGDWGPPDALLDPGDVVVLPGGRSLEVIATPGHTRGHLVLLDREARLLFAGDHVLPHITPSLGFEPHGDERALSRFLPALHAVRDLSVDLVLPGHGPVVADLAGRVDELLEHHRRRLDACVAALAAGGSATTRDVAARLVWTRRETPFADLTTLNRMLAVTETGTHLDLLAEQGRVRRDDEPVLRWS